MVGSRRTGPIKGVEGSCLFEAVFAASGQTLKGKSARGK